jgi:SET domain-containing protein
MLLVPTRLAQSRIHGLGLFAVEPIAKGTQVWRFTKGLDQEFDADFVATLPEPARQFFSHFGYLDREVKRIILCFDNARFVNHSAPANLVTDYALDPYGLDLAAQDITAGEELTMDYASFEDGAGRF